MTTYIPLAVISAIAIITIVVLVFTQQKSSRSLSNKLKEEQQNVKKASDILELLNAEIEGLQTENNRLKNIIKTKNQEREHTGDYVAKKIHDFLDQTKLKDIMTPKVISLNEDVPFSEVPKCMSHHNIRHLPIVDDHDKLVGLITQRMMYKIKSPRKLMDGQWHYDEQMLDNIILKHVMVQEVCTLSPEDAVGKALLIMVNSKYGGIPIIDGENKLCGIVTRKDILKIAADIYQSET